MKTLFNKFMMAMVAVVMVVGFSAFKMTNKSLSSNTVDGWYEVTIDPLDPNDESKQLISSTPGATPPNDDEFGCAINNSGYRCSIYLSFHGATSVPATVADALADTENITVVSEAKMPDEN